MKIVGLIPSRLESSRFPSKPLIDIFGKTMIRRVYEQAVKAELLDDVYVVTDSDLIIDEIESHGGRCIKTSTAPVNGTERCCEALEKLDQNYDVLINVQGDEPFIHPQQIDNLATLMQNPDVEIGTLVKTDRRLETFSSPSSVKVVVNRFHKVLYFSRQAIPYNANEFLRHIGMYGYRVDILRKLVDLDPTKLETQESLEQLRWLENGYEIHVSYTDMESESVDTPQDLEYILEKYSTRNI